MTIYDTHLQIERHLQALLDTAEVYGKCKHNPLVSTQDYREIMLKYTRAREDFVEWLTTYFHLHT